MGEFKNSYDIESIMVVVHCTSHSEKQIVNDTLNEVSEMQTFLQPCNRFVIFLGVVLKRAICCQILKLRKCRCIQLWLHKKKLYLDRQGVSMLLLLQKISLLKLKKPYSILIYYNSKLMRSEKLIHSKRKSIITPSLCHWFSVAKFHRLSKLLLKHFSLKP